MFKTTPTSHIEPAVDYLMREMEYIKKTRVTHFSFGFATFLIAAFGFIQLQKNVQMQDRITKLEHLSK